MSMLGEQIKELREAAEKFEGYQCGEVSGILREAADTIDAMLDRLYELQHVSCDSRWHELFGTPERAARTMVDMCEGGTFDDCGGCPAALAECKLGDYDALLEWLKGVDS